jgi:tetratricopeptide (TPR) repeat protein
VVGVDVLKLPLSTLEGFVLSRVDGRASTDDIGLMTGVEQERLAGILDRLAELGAVELAWRPRREKPPTPKPPPDKPPDSHFAGRGRYVLIAQNEKVDISQETRRRIVDAHEAVSELNLYELLGVEREADKRQIRDAYFALSKVFHPDAYFGKNLGTFKPKMEAVFKRLTSAYEILGKPKKRAEYDQYLATTEQTKKARKTLDSIKLTPQQADELAALSRGAAKPSGAPPPSSPAPAARVAVPPPPTIAAAEAARVPPYVPTSTAERRARIRDRLRRGLQSVAPPAPEPTPTPEPAAAPTSTESRHSVIAGLRQSIRASSALSGNKGAQVQSHLKKARDAENGGDVLLAASQLQLALAIAPENLELVAEYDRVSKVVARNLADNYEKQAQYEEKTGNWQAASRSWTRVSDGRPEDARAAARGAEALLRAGGDLHEAQRLASRAAQLDAKSVENLTILARVYLAAGLKKNALRELQRAHELAPRDEMVNNLLREAR